jgi:hypothetical protein
LRESDCALYVEFGAAFDEADGTLADLACHSDMKIRVSGFVVRVESGAGPTENLVAGSQQLSCDFDVGLEYESGRENEA